MKGIVQAEQCVMYVRAYVIWLMHLIDYVLELRKNVSVGWTYTDFVVTLLVTYFWGCPGKVDSPDNISHTLACANFVVVVLPCSSQFS